MSVSCMCADGVLVDVDLGRLRSHLLRSVAEAAPGDVIPLPGVASKCIYALQSLNSNSDVIDQIDLIRAAIELDCDMSVHVTVMRYMGGAMMHLVDMDTHQVNNELRRWFDTFAAAPPLYIAYALDTHGRIRDRLRNLLSHCLSPSSDVVNSAVDFLRRMGRCSLSDPEGASEVDCLARALAGSEVVRDQEVTLAKCLIEHVRVVAVPNIRNFWEVLCESCLVRSKPADAMAIADICPPCMGFNGLVRSLIRFDIRYYKTTDGSRAFIEHLYASKDDETRDMIWQLALDSPRRDVIEWAMAFTGKQLTCLVLKQKKNRNNIELLFFIAIRDDRCTDAQTTVLLHAFKAHLSIELLQLEKVARLLGIHGSLTSDLLVSMITRTKPNTIMSEVIEHLAASPGLRRGSDGWFEAISYFAKRRDLAAMELLLMRKEVG